MYGQHLAGNCSRVVEWVDEGALLLWGIQRRQAGEEHSWGGNTAATSRLFGCHDANPAIPSIPRDLLD